MPESARAESFALKYLLHHPNPGKMETGVLYLERADSGAPQFAHFLCPCGCGDVTSIPAQGSMTLKSRPKWDFKEDPEGLPTITPSVHKLDGCESHYFIRGGKVEWC